MYQAAAISHSLKGQDEVDMAALKEAGACGFTDDGIPLTNAAFCYRAMQNAAKLDMPISLHEEDPAFIKNNGINHGKYLTLSASTAHHPSLRKPLSQETVYLRCAVVLML